MADIHTWQFHFHTFDANQVQEDGILSDGDEPYLVFLGFRSTFRKPGSTQAFWSGYLEEDWANGIESGEQRAIPQAMGMVTYPDVNLLSAADVLATGQMPEILGYIAIALESDATPFGEIRGLIDRVRDACFNEMKRLIENGNVDLANPAASIQQAVQNVRQALDLSVGEMIRLFFASWTDPDDIIGTNFGLFVAGDPSLRDRLGAQGAQLAFLTEKPIDLVFAGDDARYTVHGLVRKLGWRQFELAPANRASVNGGITSVSRIPGSMEVWWIGANGSVQDAFWYEGQEGWRQFELAPAGSAAVDGGITAVSRIPGSMEVWWIGANGSVQAAFWYDGSPWQRYELAPAGSASVNGGITAVSRIENSMEVWWIGADGSVQDAFWYDGSPWQRFPLAGAGSASVNGDITAVSRIPGSMEVWWIGADGSVQDAFWYDGSPWQCFPLAGAGSASLTGGIAAVSRIPGSMEVWWIGADGSVRDAFWYDGAPWQGFELAPAGSASTNGDITAVSRIPGSMEIWWIGADGSVQDGFWYEGQEGWRRFAIAPAGSAALGGAITAVSRIPGSMEIWWIGGNGSVQDGFVYL